MGVVIATAAEVGGAAAAVAMAVAAEEAVLVGWSLLKVADALAESSFDRFDGSL